MHAPVALRGRACNHPKEDCMPRFPRRRRLSPGMELERVVINLNMNALPSVELVGRSVTGNPRLDATARVTLVTTTLPASGEQFLTELQEMFAGLAPAPKKEPITQ
jgi:hypothetical protein